MEGGFLGFFSPDGKRGWKADQRPGQSIPEAQWRQADPGVLPAGDIYGGGSPTGIGFYENGALPPKYSGLLMSCEAGRKVVFGYFPKLEGAANTLERFDFIKSKGSNFFRPSDVMVGADGAIYVADWFDSGVGGHNDNDESSLELFTASRRKASNLKFQRLTPIPLKARSRFSRAPLKMFDSSVFNT